MRNPEGTPGAADSTADLELHDFARAEADRWKARSDEAKREARDRAKAAQVAKRLAKLAEGGSLAPVRKAVAKARSSAELSGAAGDELRGLLTRIEAWIDDAPRRLREELGPRLSAACAAHGLSVRVVSREPTLELRISPFSVVLDLDQAIARFRFARVELGTCPAHAEEIVAEYGRLLGRFGASFDASRAFDQARRGYLSAVGAEGRRDGDRLEINQVLPYIALQRQSKQFSVSPEPSKFRAYSRAHFAFDVMRLRESAGLIQGGLRLNLGVATGNSATDRNRSLFIEDREGTGEYKLTLFFTREEAQP
ncbi:MAG: hypothetical protein HYV07_07430 [Deltaproteobacteria bacterium]|nr:hypothetical protein [Deltaproteobacteria bacterium]